MRLDIKYLVLCSSLAYAVSAMPLPRDETSGPTSNNRTPDGAGTSSTGRIGHQLPTGMHMTITGNSAGGGQTNTNIDATGSSASLMRISDNQAFGGEQLNANIRGTERQIEVNDPPRRSGGPIVTSEGAGRVGTGVDPSVGSGRREPHHTGTNIGRDGPSVNPLNPNVVRPVPPPPPVPQRVQYNTVTVGRYAPGPEGNPPGQSPESTFQQIIPSSSTDPIQVMNSGHVSTGNTKQVNANNICE
ncbi:hypothetical protein FB446DRAFT_841746 [Lentinula raphanica]|nr:hypothetical protein FB446DRAFT_841746 [Lentinula raphanica]